MIVSIGFLVIIRAAGQAAVCAVDSLTKDLVVALVRKRLI